VKNADEEDFCYSYTDKVTFISKTEMLSRLECTESEKKVDPDNKLYQDSVKAILECYMKERQNEKVHLRTKYGSKKQKDNALEILHTFANNQKLTEDEKSTLQALSQAVRNGNNSLTREINKASSSVDFSNWTKYLNADNIIDDETGIITLAMER
jgi:hypothetical protein